MIKHNTDIFRRLTHIFNKNYFETDIIGKGSHASVIKLDPHSICKFYNNEGIYMKKNVDTEKFFNSEVFRDIFLNKNFSDPNIFRYDLVLHDDELGIFVTGKRMAGTILNIINDFDTNMFFSVLKDILIALQNIHVLGMIHSDVKPANILYTKTDDGNYKFILCDFDTIQITSFNTTDMQNSTIFATPNYSCESDFRDVTFDIYMLGATLLHLCINEYKNNYDLSLLIMEREKIISKFNEKCYRILEIMLAPQEKRGYIQHIKEILEMDNLHDYGEITNTIMENRIYYHELCCNKVALDFFSCDQDGLDIYYKIVDTYIRIVKKYGKYTKLDISLLTGVQLSDILLAVEILTKLIQYKFQITENTARFFSQTICLFPNDKTIKEWIDDKYNSSPESDINYPKEYKKINTMVYILCRDGISINFHLITCKSCMTDIARILRPDFSKIYECFGMIHITDL